MSESADVAPDVSPDPTSGGGPDPTSEPASTAPVRTGHPSVDGVLASMDALDDLPVAEHVAVFEQAHERLRAALSGAEDAASPPAPSPRA